MSRPDDHHNLRMLRVDKVAGHSWFNPSSVSRISPFPPALLPFFFHGCRFLLPSLCILYLSTALRFLLHSVLPSPLTRNFSFAVFSLFCSLTSRISFLIRFPHQRDQAEREEKSTEFRFFISHSRRSFRACMATTYLVFFEAAFSRSVYTLLRPPYYVNGGPPSIFRVSRRRTVLSGAGNGLR